MTVEELGPNNHVTFEVTMPRGTVDQAVALQGLCRAFNWNLRERVTLVGDLDRSDMMRPWVIEDGDFVELSQQVWGVDTYGDNATDQLRHEARRLTWQNGVFHNGFSFVDQDNPNYRVSEIDNPGPRLNPTQMESRAQEVWGKHRSPFELEHNPIGPRVPRHLTLRPGPVARDHLADYSRARGYDRHQLHGSLGKTLDLFSLASGLLRPEDLRSGNSEFEFIDTPELFTMMDEQISPSARRRILSHIDRQLEEQLKLGTPVSEVETVVEGLTTRNNKHPYYEMTYEKIATSSLVGLADLYTRDSQGRRFLRQFNL